MEKNARFILKADKYTLLIIHLIDSNKKTKKGISIYNKTLEINELNEDNINMVLNKKDKIVYSFHTNDERKYQNFYPYYKHLVQKIVLYSLQLLNVL